VITIDGSMGEGGGQVLRSSLALSAITGQAVRLVNIRRGRQPRGGLLRQHLTCVRAAAAISGAAVTGDTLRSTEITFAPGPVRAGDYAFAIGTAGSTSLVLQTVLLPLALAEGPSTVRVEGGTHNSGAPPFDFLDRAFRPAIPGLSLTLASWGFYPAGGGEVVARVSPGLAPVARVARGAIRSVDGHAAVSALAPSVGHRALGRFREALDLDRAHLHLHEVPRPVGPGFACWIEVAFDGGVEVFTGFGEKHVRAETLAERCLAELDAWRALDVPVGEHLADQLLLPMALAGGRMRTGPLSLHARTNIEVIERFLGPTFRIAGDEVRATRPWAGSSAP
jgi:RNA 3'-terminal phosphate cyclase (ATP)